MSDAPFLSSPDRAPRRLPTGLYGFAGGLIGGIAAAVIVGVVLAAMWPTLRSQIIPEPHNDDVVLAALDHRLAAMESAAGKSADGNKTTVADLQKRLDALEQASHAPPAVAEDPRVATLNSKLDDLNTQIAALRASNTAESDLQPLVQRAETAAQTARDAAAKRQSAEAMLVVAGQLHEAVERGSAYTTELAAARKVAPQDAMPALDALAKTADSGVTPRHTLADSFPAVASAITRAALMADVTDGFWGRLENKASTLISVRRVDGKGSDPASIAARAEKDLNGDDLASAIKEVSSLEGAPAAEAKDWLTAAQARLAAEQALSDLTAKSGAALTPSDG